MHLLSGCLNMGSKANKVLHDTSVDQKSETEESWMPRRERNNSKKQGVYQRLSPKALHLNHHKKKETVKECWSKGREVEGFSNFQKAVSNDLAASSDSHNTKI